MLTSLKRYINNKYHEDAAWAVFVLQMLGYGGHWIRKAMNDEVEAFVEGLAGDDLVVAEISGGHFAHYSWGDYVSLQYPEFDICEPYAGSKQYDLIFCEQVLEHVLYPQRALRNLYDMLRGHGLLIISTPFLVKIHNCPSDFWRFTPEGLRLLLEEAGFQVEALHAWGNRACVKANLTTGDWARYRPFRSLQNEKDFPVVVWAYARKR